MSDYITIKDFPDEQLISIFQIPSAFTITPEMAEEEYELRHKKAIAQNPYLKYEGKIIHKITENSISAYKFDQYNKNTDDIQCQNIEINEKEEASEAFLKTKTYRRKEWNIDYLFYDYEEIDEEQWEIHITKVNNINQIVKDTIKN